MKYLLSILLIAALSGCSFSPGNTAKNIGNKVKKSCASLCLRANIKNVSTVSSKEDLEPVSVFTTSVLERTANILTW